MTKSIENLDNRYHMFLLIIALMASLFVFATILTAPFTYSLTVYSASAYQHYLDAHPKPNPIKFFLNSLTIPIEPDSPNRTEFPLIKTLYDIYFFLFGTNTGDEAIIMIPFFVILLFSLFFLGKLLWGNKAAIISTLSILAIPHFFELIGLLPMASLSLLSLSVYFMFSSNKFKDTNKSLLAGISVALFLLVKYANIFYLLALLLYPFVIFINRFKRNNYSLKNLLKKRVKNMVLFFILIFFISGSWYIPMFFTYLLSLLKLIQTEILVFDFFKYLGPFLFLGFLIIVFKTLKNNSLKEKILLAIFYIPFFFFFFLPVKNINLYFPSYFVFSLFFGEIVSKIKFKNIQIITITIVLLAIFANMYSYWQFSVVNPDKEILLRKEVIDYIANSNYSSILVLNEVFSWNLFEFEYFSLQSGKDIKIYYNYYTDDYKNLTKTAYTHELSEGYNEFMDKSDVLAISFDYTSEEGIEKKIYALNNAKYLVKEFSDKFIIDKIFNKECFETIQNDCQSYVVMIK